MDRALSSLCFFLIACVSYGDPTHSPKGGFIPNQDTAIKVAEAVLIPIYGEQVVKERPFKANLVGDHWVVEGSLQEGVDGGVAHIEIRKSNGEILKVIHGK